tara:strand:+ start:822 stop:1070 length:249 start_codon:yes stop_codon:yes gene_type:complete
MFNPYNHIKMIPTQSYKEWFHSPVKDSGKDWKNNKTHGEYIQYFYAKLTQIIRENGFNINNEKQFKSEIATFIYNLSDQSNE